jgi:hypothetical protein
MSLRHICLAALLLGFSVFSGTGLAGEKGLMHCFAFAPLSDATEADWEAFYKVSDELPGKVEGLQKIWVGKLRAPAKLNPNADPREYGACMLFDDADALKEYGDHAAHRAWEEVYFKVRQPGSTTFDVIGQ